MLAGGYLHALNLVPWWLVGWWLAATCVSWSLCLGGSCPWLKWLPACLEPRALLVGVSLCALVGVLGGGYLHALVVRALVVGVVRVLGSWLAVTCMP